MICRKCSFILQGSEKFCPNCGADCSQKPQTEKTDEIQPPTPPSILFSPPQEPEQESYRQRIFREEIEEEPDPPSKIKKSKAPAVLVVLLITVILCVGGITAMEYLDLAPAIMQYLETGGTSPQKEETQESTSQSDYPSDYGVIAPDINFRPTICYIATDGAVSLKKGPDNSYAALSFIESGVQLQVIGGSSVYEGWVYVYIPAQEVYGWLSAAFLSEVSALEEEETTEEEVPQEEETTQEIKY